MRVLIVKLSSLGDVVHAMPVVADIRRVDASATIDWVVEAAFAPLLRRVDGVDGVIEIALRRWRKAWWTAPVRAEWRGFRKRLRRDVYDVVIDLQGLTKSALVARLARGVHFGLANRTEGAGHEWPARWLADRPIRVEPHIHAVDRSRVLVGSAIGLPPCGPPRYGLRACIPIEAASPKHGVVFVHGTTRADKQWPESHWIELGRRLIARGQRIELPQAGAIERRRVEAIAAALGDRCTAWPEMALDALVDRMAAADGVIGVDSGLSHIAVALDLPHVQIYNLPTAWRTGPQSGDGHRHQVAIEARPSPRVDAVEAARQAVRPP